MWARAGFSDLRRRAWAGSCSTVAASCFTGASRRWRKRHAKADWNSKWLAKTKTRPRPPQRKLSQLPRASVAGVAVVAAGATIAAVIATAVAAVTIAVATATRTRAKRSEEHTSELQSQM